jgi:hypothetical protein
VAKSADLELALAYLVGRLDRSGPLVTTSYDLTDEEAEEARLAKSRLLEANYPPRDLLNALSAVFKPEGTMTSGNRRLAIRSRRKGPPRELGKGL